MNTCSWTSRLGAYHDGELPAPEAAALEAHLGDCALCQRELRDYRRLSLMLGRIDIPELSVSSVARIKRQIQREGNVFILRFARRMTGVAAALLLAGTLWLINANTSNVAAAPVNDWEAAAVSPNVDATQQNTGAVQLAMWIQTDLSRK